MSSSSSSGDVVADCKTGHSANIDLAKEQDKRTPPSPPAEPSTEANDMLPKTSDDGARKTVNSRLQYRREYQNANDEVVFTQELGASDLSLEDPAHAIVVCRTYYTNFSKDAYRPESEKHLPPPVLSTGSTWIEIRSRAVVHALKTVIGYYPEFSLTGDTIRINEPYEPLYHYRAELQKYRDQFSKESGASEECKEDPNVAQDISTLLDVFDEMFGERVKHELARHQLPRPTCTHEMLWMLFKPGSDVYEDYHHDNKSFGGRVVRQVTFSYKDKRASEYEIMLWGFDCNFGYVGADSPFRVTIPPFAGEKEIADLVTFPCRFMRKDKHDTTHEEHFKRLAKRGEMFFDLLKKPQMAMFEGQSATWPPKSYKGRAMIDMNSYCVLTEKKIELAQDVEVSHIVVPRCECSRCSQVSQYWQKERITFAGYSHIEPEKKSHLTEHQRFLCPMGISAYLLKHREWVYLKVEGFAWPEYRENAIETLVIPAATRHLLHSLCRKFTCEKTWSADFIEGKGEGSIVLLHGKPGVGKTFTAECVAEQIKRPLISLTCADIGTSPETVEKNLLKWFELAKFWRAVLLLDEADVFLERRSASDLARNNLVAIFLRTLEYYQGILFLTTNRVGTFDEAFLSRIDVPIWFPPLEQDQRVQIWSSFFTKLEKERQGTIRVSQDVKYYVKEDRDLLALEWNGREIRSGFQTAVALAEIEGVGAKDEPIAVRVEHIQKVVEMSKDFKKYLERLQQQTQDQLAAQMRLRYDLPLGDENTHAPNTKKPY